MDKRIIDKMVMTAIEAAIEAGDAIMKIYESDDFEVQLKDDNSPLSRADLESNKTILKYLESTGIPVLSEEGRQIDYEERAQWLNLWIIDPLDGTKEFIKKNGDFTVNIALIEDQKSVAGVIYVPVSRELYFGTEELGSKKIKVPIDHYEVSTLINEAERLPLSRGEREFTIVASRSHPSKETNDFIEAQKSMYGEVDLISRGSSLKICMVAEGSADLYPRFAPTMEWDIAAGHAISKFAGKNLIDFKTKKEMQYNRPQLLNNWFIVQ